MIPSEQNQVVLARLQAAFAQFVSGDTDLAEFQSEVCSTASLFENDGTGAADAVRLAEADMEEIRFTRPLNEQRPATIFRIEELMVELTDGRHA